VGPAKDRQDYAHNSMSYIGETKNDGGSFPSQIIFDACVEPETFNELRGNTKTGLLPSQITFGLAHPPFYTIKGEPPKIHPLEYGWEPDGSWMTWHNKEHNTVAIESIRFDYAVAKTRHDQEHPEPGLASYEPEHGAVEPQNQRTPNLL
jgi:hypothetical protein